MSQLHNPILIVFELLVVYLHNTIKMMAEIRRFSSYNLIKLKCRDDHDFNVSYFDISLGLAWLLV